MNISTEQLKREHLPLLELWIRRTGGVITSNDLPTEKDKLNTWYDCCTEDPERLDCLALVYETPVGITGLRYMNSLDRTASLYLLLGELNYNRCVLQPMSRFKCLTWHFWSWDSSQ